MISNFEACLQNPSLSSRFFPFSGIEKVPQVYSFWKWGALIFAIFATSSSIIGGIKLIFFHFQTAKPPPKQNEEIEFSEDDDISLASSDDEQDEEEEEENSPTTSFRGQQRADEDFCVKGSRLFFKTQRQNFHLRQRRRRNSGSDWWELTSGENVVKLWDSLGLSLDFDQDLNNNDSKNIVSIWDFDQDQTISEYFGRISNIPAMAMTSPAVVLTAEGHWKGDDVVFNCYDTRMYRHTPALHAEWQAPAADVTGVVAGDDGKVYFRDDISGVVTVGDGRNMRMPLESVRESGGNAWWETDAVIVEDIEFDES